MPNFINSQRFQDYFTQISQFGALKGGGIARLAFSEADFKAREFLISLLKKHEFLVEIDAVGNIFAKFQTKENAVKKPICVGSHIDSVVNGGIYDGTLGVMAGFEAILSIKENGVRLNRPLWLIVFVCEESSRFKIATIGSKILASKLGISELQKLKDENEISVFEAMENFGLDPKNLASCVLQKGDFKAFLELHIEQGPVLENKNLKIGFVNGIAAPIRNNIKIIGNADHSGATPMNMRRDALTCAAEIILMAEKMTKNFKTAVATIGVIKAVPNVLNVVPGKVNLGLDVRDINRADLRNLNSQILNSVSEICQKRGLKYEINELCNDSPVVLDSEPIEIMQEFANELKVQNMVLPSGAGHDAMHMKEIAELVGMIFIPCKGGISHNIAEEIDFADAILGA